MEQREMVNHISITCHIDTWQIVCDNCSLFTANEPTPTHFKDSMKHVAANHAKEGVVGEGRGERREGVQEDTRPIYEQLDIIGNEVEDKQTGGTAERGMSNVILMYIMKFDHPLDRKCRPRSFNVYTVRLHCQH